MPASQRSGGEKMSGSLLNFTITSRRRRKWPQDQKRVKVPGRPHPDRLTPRNRHRLPKSDPKMTVTATQPDVSDMCVDTNK